MGGGNPINQREPKPPADPPKPPKWLGKYALEEWRRVASTLHSIGTVSAIDGSMLAAYCEAFGRYRQAVEDLDKMASGDDVTHGVVFKTKEGNAIQNPQVGAVNVLRRDALRLAAEFGLTPSARTQIEALPGGSGAGRDPIARKYGLR